MAPRPRGRGPGEQPAPKADLAQSERFRTLVQLAHRQPALRASEQDALIEQAAVGSRAAHEQLFIAKAEMLLRRAAAHREQGLSLEDLFQEATVAFMKAVDSYPGSGRGDFNAYVEERVEQGLEAALREEGSAAGSAARLVRDAADFDRVQAHLTRELGRLPSDGEVAEKLEWQQSRTAAIRELVEDARRRHDEEILAYLEPQSMDEASGPDGSE